MPLTREAFIYTHESASRWRDFIHEELSPSPRQFLSFLNDVYRTGLLRSEEDSDEYGSAHIIGEKNHYYILPVIASEGPNQGLVNYAYLDIDRNSTTEFRMYQLMEKDNSRRLEGEKKGEDGQMHSYMVEDAELKEIMEDVYYGDLAQELFPG